MKVHVWNVSGYSVKARHISVYLSGVIFQSIFQCGKDIVEHSVSQSSSIFSLSSPSLSSLSSPPRLFSLPLTFADFPPDLGLDVTTSSGTKLALGSYVSAWRLSVSKIFSCSDCICMPRTYRSPNFLVFAFSIMATMSTAVTVLRRRPPRRGGGAAPALPSSPAPPPPWAPPAAPPPPGPRKYNGSAWTSKSDNVGGEKGRRKGRMSPRLLLALRKP